MPNKIYVITSGDYSDYRICGVTTDYERAKEMLKIVSADVPAWEDPIIEEFEDGVFEEERMNSIVPKEYWRVYLYSNKPPELRKYTADELKEKISVSVSMVKGPWEFKENGYPMREIFYEYTISGIVAEDEEHALKIATDKIAEYKAQKENITC